MKKQKFSTIEHTGGETWEEISKILKKEDGVDLSASRIRGIFVSSMEKFANKIVAKTTGKQNKKLSQSMSVDSDFQSAIGELIRGD